MYELSLIKIMLSATSEAFSITNDENAKMKDIADWFSIALKDLNLPMVEAIANDYLGSSIRIRGTFDPKPEWRNGMFENSRYFVFDIIPHSWKYHYEKGDKILIKPIIMSPRISSEYWKYTGTPESVIEELINWIQSVN